MKKLIIHPKLEAFLRKHKCLTVFKRNVLKQKNLSDGSVEKALQEASSEAIVEAFTWWLSIIPKHTPLSPFAFWSALHYKWKHELE